MLKQGFAFTEEDLLILRDDLYNGSWQEMLSDLKRKKVNLRYAEQKDCSGFSLRQRIKRDIKRIEGYIKKGVVN